jgi:hypothetical protein
VTGESVPIRRCPECSEEFQPHIVRCSDCGALLEAAFEGDASPDERGDLRESAPPLPEYARILDGLSPAMAELAAQHLSAAGIPVALTSHYRYGLRLGVKAEDAVTAIAILEREGIVPKQPDASEAAVAAEGGPCPACGDDVAPGTAVCPGCGLRLAGGVPCRHCGAELPPPIGECPECGKEQD